MSTPAAPPADAVALPPLLLTKMGPQDDSESFVELFEHTAKVCLWPISRWSVCLLLLLLREAQLTAQQLPAARLPDYLDQKWAIMQWVGCTLEQHH